MFVLDKFSLDVMAKKPLFQYCSSASDTIVETRRETKLKQKYAEISLICPSDIYLTLFCGRNDIVVELKIEPVMGCLTLIEVAHIRDR